MASRFDVGSDSEDSTDGGAPSLQLPTSPPFIAYCHNVQEDTKESDVRDFFGELDEIVSVMLIKGDAKVEFKERDTLARALFYSGRLLSGREVKVDLKPGPVPRPLPPAPPAVAEGSSSASSHKSDGGGGRDRGEGRGEGRGGGRGGRWSSNRDGGDGGGRSGRGRGGGRSNNIFGRSNERDAPRRPPPAGEGGEENKEKEGEEAAGGERPQRPKLQLKPRSKPLAEAGPEGGEEARKPSIFGGGKPHDELEFEKKWQEKHKDDPKPAPVEGEEDGEARAPTGSRYTVRKPPGAAGAEGAAAPGGARARSGSWGSKREGAAGGAGRGAAGGRGAGAAGRGPNPNKKPVVKKAPVGDDEWQEVEQATVKKRVESSGRDGQEEDKGGITRVVGGAFAALHMLDEDSD